MIDEKSDGNVLFLILLAVALFAALAYAVSSSMKGGGDNSSTEQARLAASALETHVSAIQTAIQRLKIIANCSDTDISFRGSPYTATGFYYNSTSPADFRCHIFHPAGGNIAANVPDRNWIEQAATGFHKNTYYFMDGYNFAGPGGSTLPDVIMVVQAIKKNICDEINKRAGFSSPISQNLNASFPADGVFGGAGTLSAAIYGTSPFGCVYGDLHGSGDFRYQAYYLIMLR